MPARTLYDKLWDLHFVCERGDGSSLIYIDRHIIHEVTSPQAFEALRLAGRMPWRVSSMLATPEHNVPTTSDERLSGVEGIKDPTSKIQVKTLDKNCEEFGISEFKINDRRQGIVHVMAPETGACLPGMTVVCGDSHTSTNGALGALSFGIGTSEVEHVMATQCISTRKMKNMLIRIEGKLGVGITAKDVALAIIGKLGTAGGTGYTIEFGGSAVRNMSMEGRLTLCNMAIEAGARSGMVAVDDITLGYVKDRLFAPKGEQWETAVKQWQELKSDENAVFDQVVEIQGDDILPQVTWGTSPEMVLPINGFLPDPANELDPVKKQAIERALSYMDLKPNQAITDIPVDRVFIGSCTNGRIEDIRAAAKIIKGRRKKASVHEAIVVPGSGAVKMQAESEGLDQLFIEAGFEWREPGCSMCLAMNADKLSEGEHCASTSNRNFEGRQGYRGRTHLVSPAMAAAAAIAGKFIDIREIMGEDK